LQCNEQARVQCNDQARGRRIALLVIAPALAGALALWPVAVSAQATTTTTEPATSTSAPTTVAPTTSTLAPTTSTSAPVTTSTVPETSTTRPHETSTSSTTSTTTTTQPAKATSSSQAAWVWAVVGVAVLAAIVVLLLVLARARRQTRSSDWINRASAQVDEVDSLAMHIGSAEAAALPQLAGRDAPRLASLAAGLSDLRREMPEGAPGDELARLAASAGQLQTLLRGTLLPGEGVSATEVHRASSEVASAAATARAALQNMATGLQGPARRGG